MKTDWNASQFSLLPTLMMWYLAGEVSALHQGAKHTPSPGEGTLKQDPGDQGTVAELAAARQGGGSADRMIHKSKRPPC